MLISVPLLGPMSKAKQNKDKGWSDIGHRRASVVGAILAIYRVGNLRLNSYDLVVYVG